MKCLPAIKYLLLASFLLTGSCCANKNTKQSQSPMETDAGDRKPPSKGNNTASPNNEANQAKIDSIKKTGDYQKKKGG